MSNETNPNGRFLSLEAASNKFTKMLDAEGIEDEYRRAAFMGFTDGHKYGFRAAAGSAYIALNVLLDTIGEDTTVADIRNRILGLRDAIQEGAR